LNAFAATPPRSAPTTPIRRSTSFCRHASTRFRSAIGILGLVKRYGPDRVDAACASALLFNARSYESVAAILRIPQAQATAAVDAPILFHPNIRVRDYYN
jgi:transposase